MRSYNLSSHDFTSLISEKSRILNTYIHLWNRLLNSRGNDRVSRRRLNVWAWPARSLITALTLVISVKAPPALFALSWARTHAAQEVTFALHGFRGNFCKERNSSAEFDLSHFPKETIISATCLNRERFDSVAVLSKNIHTITAIPSQVKKYFT